MELITAHLGEILVAILVIVNVFSFIVMGHDKRKAARRDGSERTPEGFIFFMAAMFGSIGVFTGMYAFRHKTRTWYFQLGIPLLIFQNLATVYLLWKLAGGSGEIVFFSVL
jgi:uncharacterized membrane protein YsdA (DUF1294 family)